MAAWLAARGVSANAISVCGMAFAVLAGCAFVAAGRAGTAWAGVLMLVGAACVQARLLCNLLDGLVAVEHARGTRTGPLFNEAPDRISDVLILVGWAEAAGAGAAGLALGLGAALAAVGTAYVRVLGAELGVGHHFLGPMAKPQRMALVTAGALIAAVAPRAWWPVVVAVVLWVVVGGCVITIARRVAMIFNRLGSPP